MKDPASGKIIRKKSYVSEVEVTSDVGSSDVGKSNGGNKEKETDE